MLLKDIEKLINIKPSLLPANIDTAIKRVKARYLLYTGLMAQVSIKQTEVADLFKVLEEVRKLSSPEDKFDKAKFDRVKVVNDNIFRISSECDQFLLVIAILEKDIKQEVSELSLLGYGKDIKQNS